MSVESTIYSVLSAAGGVTSITSTRIYPDALPENSLLPAIVFTREKTEYLNTLLAAGAANRVTMEIWCMASSRVAADALADAAYTALVGSMRYPEDRKVIYNSETDIYITMLSLSIWAF